MALVTNANSGIGLVACYEQAIAGRGCIVGVAQRGFSVRGEGDAFFLDRVHDAARLFRVKCDVSDAAAWSDTLAWANNFDAHEPSCNPILTRKAIEAQMQAMDSLDVLDVLAASLSRMLGEKGPIDALQQRRLQEFRRRVAGGLQEARARARTEPRDAASKERLAQCQESLLELSRLIDAFQREGLVKEHPRVLPPKTVADRFPSEAAAASRHGADRGCESEAEPAKDGDSPEGEEAATPAKDALLELIERELEHWQARPPAEQGASAGPSPGPEFEHEAVPGSRPSPHALHDTAGLDCATRGPERPQPAAESMTEEAFSQPPLPRSCEACGQQCAASRSHCPECQRVAERDTLADAIARAKEEARAKAEEDAARRVRRQEAERRAEEEAARKLREDAERRAKEAEEAQKAEALKTAKAEGKAKGSKKVPEDLICPKSHLLQKFVAPAGLQCQVCDEEAAQAAPMWGCRYKDARGIRTCFYDVCARCKPTRSKRKLRAAGEVV